MIVKLLLTCGKGILRLPCVVSEQSSEGADAIGTKGAELHIATATSSRQKIVHVDSKNRVRLLSNMDECLDRMFTARHNLGELYSKIRGQIEEVVRSSVKATLNGNWT
jgi:hypothetical protein